MSYGELTLSPERKQRNAVNGQFLKGHVPHNRGKKWGEYMSRRSQERSSIGWKNVLVHTGKRSECCGRMKRKVIAVMPNGKWYSFGSIAEAANSTGSIRENISRCCRLNASGRKNMKTGKTNTDHKYDGVRWYYDDDNNWLVKISKL